MFNQSTRTAHTPAHMKAAGNIGSGMNELINQPLIRGDKLTSLINNWLIIPLFLSMLHTFNRVP